MCPDARVPVVAIVTPVYNEEEVIRLFLDELGRVLNTVNTCTFTIVVIDDGSTDATLRLLNSAAGSDDRLRIYSLSRNFGHQVAITCGLDACPGADAVIVMDSDLQHPPALVPVLVARWLEGCDVVQAVRRRTEDASRLKNITSRAFYWLFNRLSPLKIRDQAADFFLLSARALSAVVSLRERHRFLRGMVSWVGFPSTAVEYAAPRRPAGRSKYGLLRMVGLASDAILSFSAVPLLFAVRLGLVLISAGALYLFYVIVRVVWMGDAVQGWPSTISVVLILGGAQIMTTGLLGAYLARVFEEVKRRPLYVLKQAPLKPVAQERPRPDGSDA
jgi:polyisoprenyl-phosphate glycosyltransferase